MSTLKADTIVAADGTSPVTLTKQSAAKAWVNFDGTLATAASDLTGVRGSFNITSLVDHSAGIYTTAFVSTMSNANYSTTTACNLNNAYSGDMIVDTHVAGSVKTKTYYGAGFAGTDVTINCHSNFGDLA